VANQPVEGETADGTVKIWGDRAESRIEERKAEFIGNARVHHTQGARGLTKIRGDRAILDRAQEEIWFEKRVQVEQDKVTGNSNRARLSYAPRERSVTYMSLLDDVKIREGKRHTRSQVAEFFAPTDTIVLTGFPAVYHGDDAVTGDRITLYRATGVVEVTQTNAAASPGREGLAPARPRPLTKEDEELIP
jgi:lipopolysaccharide export system protein LptA